MNLHHLFFQLSDSNQQSSAACGVTLINFTKMYAAELDRSPLGSLPGQLLEW
jgi:hypothetical protein